MEYTKGSSFLPTTMRQQKESLKFPLVTGASTSSPSRCTSSVSKALPFLVVALLLLSTGMIMYNTNCSFSVLAMVDSSETISLNSAHSEAMLSPAEVHLNRRLRGIAHYLQNISPAATARGVVVQLVPAASENHAQVHHDAVPPTRELELLPTQAPVPDHTQSRRLRLMEQTAGKSRWPNLRLEQKMHPVPNGPDPIHNR